MMYLFGNGPETLKEVHKLLDAHGAWTEKAHIDREFPELSYIEYSDIDGAWIGRSQIDGEGDRTFNIKMV